MTATVQSFIAGDPSTDYRTRAKNYSWTDVDVPDVLRLDVPMELRLELRAVVGLDDVDSEREPLSTRIRVQSSMAVN